MPVPEVTLCIPAWRSEPFIEESLAHACAQTYSNLRIVVSIDQCEDRTEAICRRIALGDSRIVVLAQQVRLGWAGNVNFLLRQVKSPLFVFYWHDDVIGPRWVEILAQALLEAPEAVSVYGSTRHFGSFAHHDLSGKSFSGPITERLIEVLTHIELYGLTRCMIRKEVIDRGLKAPQLDGRDYYENNTPYWLGILAAGPMLYTPEAEYHRRNGTGSSLVDGWIEQPRDTVITGLQQNVKDCLQIIQHYIENRNELAAVTYALYLFIMRRLRLYELHSGHGPQITPGEISSTFTGLERVDISAHFDEQYWERMIKAQSGISKLEASYKQNKGVLN